MIVWFVAIILGVCTGPIVIEKFSLSYRIRRYKIKIEIERSASVFTIFDIDIYY